MYKFAQALRRMRQEEKGFTLVELMVVIVIIGILAAVAVPKFTGVIDQSRFKADVTGGKMVLDAMNRYYTEQGKFPLQVDVTATETTHNVSDIVTELKATKYLDTDPSLSQKNTTINAVFKVTYTANKASINIVNIKTPTEIIVLPAS